MGRTPSRAALGAAMALLVGAGVAMAETSSWSSRVDPAAPIEKSQKKPAAKPFGPVTVIKAVPVAPERLQQCRQDLVAWRLLPDACCQARAQVVGHVDDWTERARRRQWIA